jgi:3-methyladenine DNA glycosylase/8-oxoguanine DNA glycosylase
MPHFNYGQLEIEHLQSRDSQLAAAIHKFGMLEREITPDPFIALLKCMVAQQISTKAAETVWNRLSDKFANANPHNIVNAEITDIQQCGLSMRKAGYIKNIAEKTVTGEVNFSAFAQMSDQEIIKQLSSLNGVGVWTVEMLLIFSLCRSDVVSWGDLGIRRGMMNLYGLSELSKAQFEQYRQNYSPYGSVASFYLWAISK